MAEEKFRTERRRAIKLVGGITGVAAFLSAFGNFSYVDALRSKSVLNNWPAIIKPKIDGKYTPESELDLTSLGNKLVSQNYSWMPKHEWDDTRSSPLIEPVTKNVGGCNIRMKYDEEWQYGMIDVLNDSQLTKFASGLFNDGFNLVFDTNEDYNTESTDDYQFFAGWSSSLYTPGLKSGEFGFFFTKGPFNRFARHDEKVPENMGSAASSFAESPENSKKRVIYEFKIRRSILSNQKNNGFYTYVRNASPKTEWLWPREMATYGWADFNGLIPLFLGTLADVDVERAIPEYKDSSTQMSLALVLPSLGYMLLRKKKERMSKIKQSSLNISNI